LGALRVGLGMVPRGEVALIIAGVGLSHGILNDRIFSVTILMTLLTTIIAPLLLNLLLKLRQSGIREEMTSADLVETLFPLPFPAISDLLLQKILDYFKNEGFFIHMLELDHPAYQMRKDTMFISLYTGPETFQFRTLRDDVSFIKTIVYEALLDLHAVVNKLKDLAKPESLRKEVAAGTGRTAMDLSQVVDPGCITLDIRETDKEGIITRLIDILDQNHKLQNRPQCLQAVLERENTMSTGMQHGIALPHGKTPGVSSMAVAVGIKKDGVDFQSIDGEPSTIFVLVISPENTTGPHIRFLASISAVLNDEDTRRQLLNCITPEQVYRILLQANR
jgi:mannitol/fructose-specific phosphotransferase system IIA component (Ntr-type)